MEVTRESLPLSLSSGGQESRPAAPPVSTDPVSVGTTPLAGTVQVQAGVAIPIPTVDLALKLKPVPVPVATGPLPSRAAAPLGGILASGDPVPVVDPHDAAVVDLALTDLSQSGDAQAEILAIQEAFAPEDESPTRSRGPLVSLRGPGGSPLFGTSLTGESRPTFPSGLPVLSALPSFGPAPGFTSDNFRGDPAPASEPRKPVVTCSRPAVYGLTVAFALSIGLMLPSVTDPCRDRGPSRPRFRVVRREEGLRLDRD
jgi:hypothetical protein